MNREDIIKLIAIRDLDVRAMELRGELDELPAEYALEEQAYQAASDELATQEEELQEARLAAQHAESDLKAQDDQIKKLSEQLSTAKTNKEYQLILAQINDAKMELARAEETGLTALERVEELGGALAAGRKTLAARKDDLEAAKGRVAGRETELQGDIGELEAQRNAITSELAAELVHAYDHIRERRDGVALVEVVDGTCQGCFVKVTAQESQLLSQGDELVRCRSCARILVLPV